MSLNAETHRIDSPLGAIYAKRWLSSGPALAPIILLHDSLGCVELWRDFPARLAAAVGRTVIAYDRWGFGKSAARCGALPSTFVDDEGKHGFAAICEHFDLQQFVLYGHSVGGGMALAIGAASGDACTGVVSVSAQAWVDEGIISGIRSAERLFDDPQQRARLARYHGDKTDWVLDAWIGTWTSQRFSCWSVDASLSALKSPLLCLHGDRDEYGSLAHPVHIHRLAAERGQLCILPACGHVPHRECPDLLLAALDPFLAQCR